MSEVPAPDLSAAPAAPTASRYVVGEELARGGVGYVSRVHDLISGQTLAMKRLIDGAHSDRRSVEAFEREYRVLARLEHPRIIRVFDYGIDAQGPYYTMELLAGTDLRKAAPLPYAQACLLLRDVATSLSLLHARRMVHRDLSPNNVRMTEDGHCKLLDFGALVEFGPSDTIVGTAPCIPPEALQGRPLDQRADLYALGALAYWLLTGRHAYPARLIRELPTHWKSAPVAPSTLVAGTPAELDELVLSLLHLDPLARPPSAAEVIARLEVIAGLPAEELAADQRNLESFLKHPRFTGRTHEQSLLRAALASAQRGGGAALSLRAMAGMGRSRLLEELGLSAQLSGFAVLRADASMSGELHGTSRALTEALLRALPEQNSELPCAVDGWLLRASAQRPLAVLVDNVDDADAASLGMLTSLAQQAGSHALLLIVSECSSHDSREAVGVAALRNQSRVLELSGLSGAEMRALVRSIFGDVPNLERFADWLHEHTAGSPMHAVEACRQLVQRRVIRHTAGVWTLPVTRPETELPDQLGQALLARLATLSQEARILADCLSLQHEQPTRELCGLLSAGGPERVPALLEELKREGVLHVEQDSVRFTSSALRHALLNDLDGVQLEHRHRRVGQALAMLCAAEDAGRKLKAGWHLIMGGDELRGADMIAEVTRDAESVRGLMSDLHRTGLALETALKVYGRHGRSLYARLPLLSGLAQAGFCENLSWSTRYGDHALDVAADLSGLRSARRMRPFIGAWPALIIALLFSLLRFMMTPKRERGGYSYRQMMTHVFTTAAALTGSAALSLDSQRAETTAAVLEPFSILPARLTPAGVYLYCRSLREFGRENEAEAYAQFGVLITRLGDPRYYPALPAANRSYLLAGAHFARASIAIFRADGAGALESARALDATGFKLYAMIASQLRYLYYTLRGEFAQAALHHAQVELHAAHVGSVWQVETWESPALLLLHTFNRGDIVGATRLVHRLELMSHDVPSLKRYSRIAKEVLALVRGDYRRTAEIEREYAAYAPRSFIGWTASRAAVSLSYALGGMHAQGRAFAEATRAHVTAADHDYAILFALNEVALALTEAHTGDPLPGLARVEAMLERYKHCDHRLLLGQLHEARATIAWTLGRDADYRASLAAAEAQLKPTGDPSLIARCVQLARMANPDLSELVQCAQPENDQFETELERTDGASASSSRTRVARLPSGQRRLPPV